MYIEFQIPSDGGYTTQSAIVKIEHDIDEWVRRHDIPYHKTKIHKYTLRLILKNEEAYFYFALTWDPGFHVSKKFVFKQPK